MTAAFLRQRRTWSRPPQAPQLPDFLRGAGRLGHRDVDAEHRRRLARLPLTHSPVAVGILMLCQFLPATALGLFGGVIVDRLDVRRVVIATQAASMLFAAPRRPHARWSRRGLAGLPPDRAARISLVFDHPARQQLTFQMVGRGGLPNAVVVRAVQRHARDRPRPRRRRDRDRGVGACFLFHAASFVAVLLDLALIRPRELFPLDRGDERPTLIRGSREAFAFLREVPTAGWSWASSFS